MNHSKEEKAMWLEDWRQSGKKPWAYAKENGLIPQTFCNWVKRSTVIKTSGFVEVSGHMHHKPEQSQGILIEKGDIKIHIPVYVWNESSRAIMEGLRVLQ